MNQPIISSNENIRSWLSWRIALIIGLAFLIYQPALRSGFIWDDDAYVTGNAALKSLGGLWDIWFHPFHLVQYYPMTFTSFWINYHLGGLNPLGYHAVNVLLHALNSLLVWHLLERLKVPRAWFAGLLFLVHPMMVESVAWITERKNVLSGFFYLLAFLSYLRFTSGGSGNRRWYFISYILFLAALLGDQQHPLLRFAEHDLVRRHARLAFRNEVQVNLVARAAAARCLAGRTGQSRRAHVLNADDQPVLAHHFEAGFQQQLLHKRIAHLYRRPVFF